MGTYAEFVPDEPFEAWAEKVEAHMPWHDTFDVLTAIDGMGHDRAEERIELLRKLVTAHWDASRSDVFNDE